MLQIPQKIIDQMIAHAEAEAPNECCGLLAGKEETVRRIYQIANLPSGDPKVADLNVPSDRRFRYVMDPQAQLQAFKQMRREGDELLAIYHSHPHSAAYPSQTDVRLAFYPESYYLIISLENKKTPDVRAFRIVDQKITEETLNVVR